MSDFAAGAPVAAPKSKVLVGGLVLVLALALFGAAFVYAGGPQIVTNLLGGKTAEPVSTTAPTSTGGGTTTESGSKAPAAAIPSGVMEDFGKRMYVEQVESQDNIKLLADGKMASFKVDSVKVEGAKTLVSITAFFKDGTKAPGVIVLKQDNKQYFVTAIRGVRTGSTGGYADDTAMNTDVEGLLADEMASAGIKTFDQPLLATLLSEQKSNQAVVSGIVDGTYTGVTLGAPADGAGTITIDIELTGKQSSKGVVTLIQKTVDGRALTFISSFKKK